jgi:uncharacterized protein YdeI (YjbR/CyaY-like superfamily)
MTDDVRFFGSLSELRKWFKTHASSPEGFWAGFHKKAVNKTALTYVEALDEALCFGWTGNVIRSIDPLTYKVKFIPRKSKSVWSQLNIKKFQALRKQGRATKQGIQAFEGRDKSKSEEKRAAFTAQQLKAFRANAKAWDFFSSQTQSYQYHTTRWVTGAKRLETQEKRLKELIEDSAQGSKLKRIVKAIEKIENRHPPGQTPIERARNIGAVTGSELRSMGIDTVEKLQSIGWEEAFQKLIESYPERLNLSMLLALIGAMEERAIKNLAPAQKNAAKAWMRAFRKSQA